MTPLARFCLIAVCSCLGALAAACSEDTTPSAEAFCGRAARCDAMQLLVAPEPCAEQVTSRLANASEQCRACALSLPCAGMERIASGKVTLAQVCPSCPAPVSRSQCGSDNPHVLVCGVALKPAGSASASASAPPAAPPASASGSGKPAVDVPPPVPGASGSVRAGTKPS